MDMNLKSLNELSLRDKLSKWFKSPLGEVVFAMENDQFEGYPSTIIWLSYFCNLGTVQN